MQKVAPQHGEGEATGCGRHEECLEDAAVKLDVVVDKISVFERICRGDGGNGFAGFLQIAPEEDAFFFSRYWKAGPRVHLDVLQAVRCQVQFAQHRCKVDHDVDGGADVDFAAGDDVVLSADRSANDVPTFQDSDLEPGLSKVGGADQAVVAGSQNGNVVDHERYDEGMAV